MSPASQFGFLKNEWPDLHGVASKAELLTYPDARLAAELDALFATLQHRASAGSCELCRCYESTAGVVTNHL